MKTKVMQIILGVLVAAPLAAFAASGSANGPLFSNVASAGYGNGQEKVTICTKNNRTITVAAPAVDAHLKNGATIGACGDAEPV